MPISLDTEDIGFELGKSDSKKKNWKRVWNNED